MPISDLLAQISGGKAGEPSSSRPITTSVKRKASVDLQSNATKTKRVTPPPLSRPIPAARPSTDRASSAGQRYNGTSSGQSFASSVSRSTPLSNRPKSSSTSSPAVTAPPRSTPKKGSFAEILARGKAAQVTMGQVGKIQHKKVEGAAKRSKEELLEAAAAAQQIRGKKPALAPGYGGTSRPLQRPAGASGGSSRTNGAISKRPGATSSSLSKQQRPAATGSGRKSGPPPQPEKKIKKAAAATTGYAGTARPKPASETGNKKRHDAAPRGGALLSAPKRRPHGGSKFDDEYDEEMDDFIDYDDEEEDEPRYGYASDASSDMEAGMDDIYDEEDRAARIARQEDVRELELEKKLKAAKEDRRRRALGY